MQADNDRLVELFRQMDAEQASDLFLSVDKRPSMRVYSEITEIDGPPITEDDFEQFLAGYLPETVPETLRRERELDIGISLSVQERYRLSIFYQKGQLAMVARRVPLGDLSLEELHLPEVVEGLACTPRGLVLITGATGSGKSSTLAAMLNLINARFAKHIVTIEDPIEFVHRDQKSIVTQREVGNDTNSFAASLRQVVRQSPDVIMIGELRDYETIQTAISAAMTGHLVLTTMHTVDVAQTLERIINYFPDHLRDQIAMDLSMALAGIISQRLLPRQGEAGLIPVFEILVATPLARRVISSRRLEEIDEVLKGGVAEGMITFNRSLAERYHAGRISRQAGAAAASNRDEFLLIVEGMETGIDTLRLHETDTTELMRVDMKRLLKAAVKHSASDLLVTVGTPPLVRIDGRLRELNMEPLNPQETRRLLFSLLSQGQQAKFESEKEIDFALSVSNLLGADEIEELKNNRFRVNGFFQKGCVAVAIRVIAQEMPSPGELGIPPVVMKLAERQHGLILVTGPTGHGKSTTLACMIDEVNRTRSCHIITVEDPIEFVHSRKKAVIEQREVYADTKSFTSALKYVLRQDPDVILIGEMRDQETISAALTAAETGHLVLATLHTNDAVQSIDRIIDSFPPYQQDQVRAQLGSALIGVIAQRLLPKADKQGRVAAFEIMLATTPVRALIRDNRIHQIPATIETSAKDGMITMDKALKNLYNQNLISRQTLLSLAKDPDLI